jgi:hypothetical protein
LTGVLFGVFFYWLLPLGTSAGYLCPFELCLEQGLGWLKGPVSYFWVLIVRQVSLTLFINEKKRLNEAFTIVVILNPLHISETPFVIKLSKSVSEMCESLEDR